MPRAAVLLPARDAAGTVRAAAISILRQGSDCHMPYIREGSVKISDHWVRSPLANLEQSCQTCHRLTKEELNERVITIQDRTAALLRRSELALVAAIDAIVAARAAGAGDDALNEALRLHRAAQLRWDFISSENSTGFHSPQEAARVIAESIDLARQAQLAAERYEPGRDRERW